MPNRRLPANGNFGDSGGKRVRLEREKAQHFSFSWLPNTVTFFNLFTGFLAILTITEKRYDTAGWLILIAFLWDSVDGNVARAFKNSTLLGKELDSLADIVSFVVAPALLVAKSWHYVEAPWTLAAVFFYLAAGAYRLARFNVQPGAKNFFLGLPSPAAAVTLSMVVLAYRKNAAAHSEHFALILFFLTILISLLMVSRISYPKGSIVKFPKGRSLLAMELILFAVTFFITNCETALALMALVYIILAPAYSLSPRSVGKEDQESLIPKTPR